MLRVLAVSLTTFACAFALSGESAASSSCRAAPSLAVNQAQADAGQRLFLRCIACHEVGRGQSRKVGPNLGAMFDGRPLAARGYNYSPAFREAAPDWSNLAKLDAFLARPSAVVPGTKMVFAGIPSAADRAKLIAYLRRETASADCD